jgi:hypothetical protein
MPVAKTTDPDSLSDYRPICTLPALSKAMEIIMRNQITLHIERNGMDESTSIRLQIKPQHNHSPLKNNEWPAIGFRRETYTYTYKAFDSVDHLDQFFSKSFAFSYRLANFRELSDKS